MLCGKYFFAVRISRHVVGQARGTDSTMHECGVYPPKARWKQESAETSLRFFVSSGHGRIKFLFIFVLENSNIKGTMKKEIEKMRGQELYCFSDPEVMASLNHAGALCRKLRDMGTEDADYRSTIEELIPGIPPTSTVCPPFMCDHGHGVVLGEHVFINYNCTMLDAGLIRIGRHTKVGPNCQFYTPQHPLDYEERRKPQETAYPITVGDDCWLGGGVVVCPGVTIGNRCIIAAGSVVTRDIPDDSLAAGCPAMVKRKLNGNGGNAVATGMDER